MARGCPESQNRIAGARLAGCARRGLSVAVIAWRSRSRWGGGGGKRGCPLPCRGPHWRLARGNLCISKSIGICEVKSSNVLSHKEICAGRARWSSPCEVAGFRWLSLLQGRPVQRWGAPDHRPEQGIRPHQRGGVLESSGAKRPPTAARRRGWSRRRDETRGRFWRPGWPGHPILFLAFLHIHRINRTPVPVLKPRCLVHSSRDRPPAQSMVRSCAQFVEARRRARGLDRHRFARRGHGTRMQTGSAACSGPMTGTRDNSAPLGPPPSPSHYPTL